MDCDRRNFLAAASVSIAASSAPREANARHDEKSFPQGFLWGAASAGHQVEGNNVSSDVWLLENLKPTLFPERSGDALNSFQLWSTDLDLVRKLGLNAYRFSLEWARIEPEAGFISIAMLDHYKALIEGCRARGLTPIVTFNHFAAPRWFSARGGWTNPDSPYLFARFCDRTARHFAPAIGYATTLNEPNTINIVGDVFPAPVLGALREMNAAAAQACEAPSFSNAILPDPADLGVVQANLLAAHKTARAAIKAVRGDLPVGVSLAMSDDQAVGSGSLRDARRASFYGAWLDLARADDFLGVQNYSRIRWGRSGRLPPPKGATLDGLGQEVYAPSLAGAVRYAHAATAVPILITEHGVNTADDAIREALVRSALADLHKVISGGVPVMGYVHWSLLDSFEWIFGFKPRFGLCSVDRATFARAPKPSATVLGGIARGNAI